MGNFAPMLFMIFLIAIGLVGGILYLFYLPIRNRLLKNGKLTEDRSAQINRAYIFVLVLFSAYQTFDAVIPGRSFYEEEFKAVTLRDIPKSAEFIEKASSYPDFHGDYCSSSQIRLSKADYDKLLLELNADKEITKCGAPAISSEFVQSLGNKDPKRLAHSFRRHIEGHDDHYLFIGFYDDNATVFVNICVS